MYGPGANGAFSFIRPGYFGPVGGDGSQLAHPSYPVVECKEGGWPRTPLEDRLYRLEMDMYRMKVQWEQERRETAKRMDAYQQRIEKLEMERIRWRMSENGQSLEKNQWRKSENGQGSEKASSSYRTNQTTASFDGEGFCLGPKNSNIIDTARNGNPTLAHSPPPGIGIQSLHVSSPHAAVYSATQTEDILLEHDEEVDLDMDPIPPLDGELYIMGGLCQRMKPNTTVECFDKSSRLWTKVCEIPNDIHCLHASVINYQNNVVFMTSAFPTLYKNFQLSLAADPGQKWQPISNERQAPCFLSAAVRLENKICCVGGYTCNLRIDWSNSLFPFPQDLHKVSLASTVEVYDPNRDSWEQLSPLPQGNCQPSLFQSCEHVIYSLGGLIQHECHHLMPSDTVQRFDAREGVWRKMGEMMSNRAFFSVVGAEYSLVCMGGIISPIWVDGAFSSGASSSVEQYDLRMNKWVPLKALSLPRCGFTSHIFEEKQIYILGGQSKLNVKLDPSQTPLLLDMEMYSLVRQDSESKLLAGKDSTRAAHGSFTLS